MLLRAPLQSPAQSNVWLLRISPSGSKASLTLANRCTSASANELRRLGSASARVSGVRGSSHLDKPSFSPRSAPVSASATSGEIGIPMP